MNLEVQHCIKILHGLQCWVFWMHKFQKIWAHCIHWSKLTAKPVALNLNNESVSKILLSILWSLYFFCTVLQNWQFWPDHNPTPTPISDCYVHEPKRWDYTWSNMVAAVNYWATLHATACIKGFFLLLLLLLGERGGVEVFKCYPCDFCCVVWLWHFSQLCNLGSGLSNVFWESCSGATVELVSFDTGQCQSKVLH